MDKERNAGYEIVEKLTVGESIFVLGQAPRQYVTWCARTDDPANYFWGHYITDYADAREDLYQRAYEHSRTINPATRKRQAEQLPPVCVSTLPSDGSLIELRRKESGYRLSELSLDSPAENARLAGYINGLLDVGKEQEAAMLAGSMFGWSTPAANPRNYAADGKARKPQDRGR